MSHLAEQEAAAAALLDGSRDLRTRKGNAAGYTIPFTNIRREASPEEREAMIEAFARHLPHFLTLADNPFERVDIRSLTLTFPINATFSELSEQAIYQTNSRLQDTLQGNFAVVSPDDRIGDLVAKHIDIDDVLRQMAEIAVADDNDPDIIRQAIFGYNLIANISSKVFGIPVDRTKYDDLFVQIAQTHPHPEIRSIARSHGLKAPSPTPPKHE